MVNILKTEKTITIHDILVRMGIFRALYASAVQFNSVLFRLIVGVLAVAYGVPADTVAVVTIVEFTLNGLLDVPFGILADRMGRIPSIAASLALIMIGLTCVYLALILNSDLSRILFIAHGVLIGIAKPLGSGSIEAFYQDAIKRRCTSESDEKLALTSLTVSHHHGKYYTTIAVILSFALAWLFNSRHLLPHAFVVGIFFYAACIVTLLRDYAALGDTDKSLMASKPKELLNILVFNSRARQSLVYNFFFWMMTVVMAGYLVISLGREWEHSPASQWSLMIAFMLGYSAFGWIFKGHALPWLIQRTSQKTYLIVFGILTLVLSAGFLFIYQNVNLVFQVAYLFGYGVIFHTATSAIQNVSMNQLMGEIKKQDYATALSFQNIPGYLAVGAYSFYLKLMRGGTPSVSEAFLSIAFISVGLIVYVVIAESGNLKKVKTSI